MLNFDDLQESTHLSKTPSLEEIFGIIAKKQVSTFHILGSRCGSLQQAIENLENTLAALQEKHKLILEQVHSKKIRQLRDKQNAFLISSLEQKVQRLTREEESMQSQIEENKRQCIQLELQLQDQRTINSELSSEVEERKKQIKELIKTNNKLKKADEKEQKEQTLQIQELPTFGSKQKCPSFSQIQEKRVSSPRHLDHGINNEEYQILQIKIKQLEEQFNSQIESERTKNRRLEQKIKRLSSEIQEDSRSKKIIYELQLKFSNITNEYKQLQHSFSEILNKNNEYEILLHKKAMQYKEIVQKEKKQLKRYKIEVDGLLKKLATDIFGEKDLSTLFIGVRSLPDRFEQVKKNILKVHKRNLHNLTMQKDLEIRDLQQKIESNSKAIKNLEEEKEKIKHQKKGKSEKTEKQLKECQIKNNSLSINNKSHNKSDNSIKQKAKIEQLVQKIGEQENTIATLRRTYDVKETEINRKLLSLEAQITKKDLSLKMFKKKLEKQENTSEELKKQFQKIKNEHQMQITKKVSQLEEQKNAYKEKIKTNEIVIVEKNKKIEEFLRKINHQEEKIKKIMEKFNKKEEEEGKVIALKEKSINDLIQKNKAANLELKLLHERISLLQVNGKTSQIRDSSDGLAKTKQELLKLKSKERELSIQLENSKSQISNLQEQAEALNKKLSNRVEKDNENEKLVSELRIGQQELSLKLKMAQNQLQAVKKSNQHYKHMLSKQKSSESFSKIKEEYEKKVKSVKNEYENRMEEYKKIKKEYETKIIKLTAQLEKTLQASKEKNVKNQFDENAERVNELNLELFRQREENRKIVMKLHQEIKEIKALQDTQKQENSSLLNNGSSIKHLNIRSIGNNNKSQFKGTDSFQLVHTGTMTENPERQQTAINTIDLFEAELRCEHEPEPLIINNILDDDYLAFRDEEEADNLPQILIQADEEIEQAEREKESEQMRSSKLVKNLNYPPPEDDDVFEICDQEEEINFGESSANLQIREFFSHIRRGIEKLFNEEEISMSVLKVLPLSLQDDFFQLTSYVKEKIKQIRMQNQISFIMAEPGNGPQSIDDKSLELPELIDRRGSEGNLKRVIEEKEAMINSLMNERVSQENTINQLTMQKQEIEEENENKFMNQCNIYKKEIKQHKKQIDVFEMNFQSLVNIVKNILEIYSDDDDQEDDFRDNMTMFARIGKLNEKDRTRINFHIHKYLEMKQIQ